MKKPAVLLAWLAVPAAGAAGYFAGASGLSGREANSAAGRQPPVSSTAFSPSDVISKWMLRLEKAKAEELPAIYREISGLTNMGEKRKALGLLYARWAEVDAPGGVAYFSQKRESPFWDQERMMVLTEWAFLDLEAAHKAAKALDPDQTPWVAWQLLEEAPERFWEWFQKSPPPLPWTQGKGWEKVLAAHFDEVAALAAQGELQERQRPGSANAMWIYQSLAASLASKNPAKAVEWAKAVPESVRGAALQGALEVVAREQPEKIAEYLLLLEFSTGGRKQMINGVAKVAVETMAARDPLSALTWMSDHYSQLGGAGQETSSVMGRALANALRDRSLTPEQAFNAVRNTDKNAIGLRFGMYARMWDGLSSDQLANAAAWLKGVDSKESRPAAMAALIGRWEVIDPAAARAFESQLDDSVLTDAYFRENLRGALMGIGRGNRDEHLTEFLGRIPVDRRAGMIAEQARYYGTGQNAAPLAESLAGVPASPEKDRALGAVAVNWGASDPLGAMEWASRQADAAVRGKVTGAAMDSWLKEDALGASEWLTAQPPGEMRDMGAHRLALALRNEEPQSAWAWAGNIQDPATRLEAQSAVLRQWRESSAVEARAAMEAASASLTPEARERLWNTVEGRVNVR